MKKSKICIATPDVIGPIKNGGIGTHAHNLAVRLVEAGWNVDLLYTGHFDHGNPREFHDYYAEKGVNFIALSNQVGPGHPLRLDPILQKSWHIYHYLKDKNYQAIHFQDWYANGFFTIQAKRTLGDFTNTALTVMLHSSTEWIAEGALKAFDRPIEDQLISWCERYCAQYSDYVISPSRYMFDWVRSKNWQLAHNAHILPCCMLEDRVEVAFNWASDTPVTLAFFGRLETRKGLEPFLAALGLLPQAVKTKIAKVLFIGKEGKVSGSPAARMIKKIMLTTGLDYSLHINLGVEAAHDLLKSQHAVAFTPSLQDNLPFTVLECTTKAIPVLGSNVGGIPEILPETALYKPTSHSIAEAIQRLIGGKIEFSAPRYDAKAALEKWVAFSHELGTKYGKEKAQTGKTVATKKNKQPLVSVCVPHYNYGRYICQMLDSLKAQTFQDFEVIVIDDGSTDVASVEIFDNLPTEYPAPQYQFFKQENGGIGQARNAAVARAQGTYIVFMDSDNIAKPAMLETFVGAIERCGADVLTCHFDVFNLESSPKSDYKPDISYMPVGQCLDLAWYDNVMGDANFIIRRSAFDGIEGFTEDRDSSWEDLELLVRLAFKGYSQDVIPQSLFWYRNQDEGFSRNTNLYKNRQRVLRVYLEHADPKLRGALNTMAHSQLFRKHWFRDLLRQQLILLRNKFPKLSGAVSRIGFLRTLLKKI